MLKQSSISVTGALMPGFDPDMVSPVEQEGILKTPCTTSNRTHTFQTQEDDGEKLSDIGEPIYEQPDHEELLEEAECRVGVDEEEVKEEFECDYEEPSSLPMLVSHSSRKNSLIKDSQKKDYG